MPDLREFHEAADSLKKQIEIVRRFVPSHENTMLSLLSDFATQTEKAVDALAAAVRAGQPGGDPA